ncbi:MAG TPA: hypothetical protein VII94_00910 [Candidatus Saccharimonadales bacterium]
MRDPNAKTLINHDLIKEMKAKRKDYLKTIELLAKEVVSAALDENSFEVFGYGPKTELQKKISEMARQLKYKHEHSDGCCSTEDPRKTGLKNGLRQLTIEQLQRVIGYPGEMVLDNLNYENGNFCALAIGVGLDKTMIAPSHEKVFQALTDMGYNVYNTRGIPGEFYTKNRLEDLLTAAKEVLQEKIKLYANKQ